jgi:hypothetical protein
LRAISALPPDFSRPADELPRRNPAELWGPVATTGQVFVKRYVPGSGFGARSNIGVDLAGADRLATADRHALPSLAIDSNTGLNVSMQRDAIGYGPTIEDVAVNPITLVPVLNPPNLIDDDAGLTLDRGRSGIAINEAMGQVWSCWSYHAAAADDDVYCRGRLTGLANLAWTEPILAVGVTAGVIEDHPTVVLQPSTARRVVAYHSDTGIKVRLFDASNNVFVAFQHIPSTGGATDERVKVTARCATGGWDDDGGELIDDSQDREQIGGDTVFKAPPAFVFDATDNRLSVTYVQAVNAGDRIGRWARKDAGLAYADICNGQ